MGGSKWDHVQFLFDLINPFTSDGGQDGVTWLKRLERLAATSGGVDDGQLLMIAMGRLHGSAYTWSEAYTFGSWPEFRTAFLSRYSEHVHVYRARLDACRQRQSERVRCYADRFIGCASRAACSDWVDLMERFISGLLDGVYQHVLCRRPSTLEEAVSCALYFEHMLESRLEATHTPGPTHAHIMCQQAQTPMPRTALPVMGWDSAGPTPLAPAWQSCAPPTLQPAPLSQYEVACECAEGPRLSGLDQPEAMADELYKMLLRTYGELRLQSINLERMGEHLLYMLGYPPGREQCWSGMKVTPLGDGDVNNDGDKGMQRASATKVCNDSECQGEGGAFPASMPCLAHARPCSPMELGLAQVAEVCLGPRDHELSERADLSNDARSVVMAATEVTARQEGQASPCSQLTTLGSGSHKAAGGSQGWSLAMSDVMSTTPLGEHLLEQCKRQSGSDDDQSDDHLASVNMPDATRVMHAAPLLHAREAMTARVTPWCTGLTDADPCLTREDASMKVQVQPPVVLSTDDAYTGYSLETIDAWAQMGAAQPLPIQDHG
jgi:hypothetical protein